MAISYNPENHPRGDLDFLVPASGYRLELPNLSVSGFGPFKELELKPAMLGIITGANGSGKSSVIGLYRLFQAILTHTLDDYVKSRGGADMLLHQGRKPAEAIHIGLDLFTSMHVLELTRTENDGLAPCLINELCFERLYEPDFCERKYTCHDRRTWAERVAGWHFFTGASDALTNWRDYPDTPGETAYLRDDCGNLAAFLRVLKKDFPGHFEAINEASRKAIDALSEFIPIAVPNGNREVVRLFWRERDTGRVWPASRLAEADIHFVCMATALLQPPPAGAVFLDDPEKGLSPAAMAALADAVHKASETREVVLASSSSELLAHFAGTDISWLLRENGNSRLFRLGEPDLAAWQKRRAATGAA